MACLTLSISPIAPSVLTVAPTVGAVVSASPIAPTAVGITAMDPSRVTVQPPSPASVRIGTVLGSKLTIGEVCTVSGGTITVLAASDGPLRTKDGGYFLLDPSRNPV